MALDGGQYNYVVMHNGETGTANGTAIACTAVDQGAYTALTVQLEGVSGETITFEATIDGTNWIAIQATDLTTGTAATTATADGLYRMTVLGLKSVRARISTGGAGTVYAYGIAVA